MIKPIHYGTIAGIIVQVLIAYVIIEVLEPITPLLDSGLPTIYIALILTGALVCLIVPSVMIQKKVTEELSVDTEVNEEISPP